jgi:glycosyltransferase involved in cell wall biosynthesis
MKYVPEEYYLHIIGNGSYKRDLLKLIRQLKLEKKVRILSDLSDDEIYWWLKTCNLCINLSEAEAFGITVIEALCAGKPVIVNDRGGLAELAKNFPQAILPVKIEKGFSHKKLAELIILHYAKEIDVNLGPFAWKNIAERIKEVYNDAGKHWDRD